MAANCILQKMLVSGIIYIYLTQYVLQNFKNSQQKEKKNLIVQTRAHSYSFDFFSEVIQ